LGTVVCPGALATRFQVGMAAQSIATVSLNIRNAAGAAAADSVRGLLPPGAIASVIGGPQCATNATWWNVTYTATNGTITTGWIAEGDAVEYWLQPYGVGVAGPGGLIAPEDMSQFAPITPANVGQLSALTQTSVMTSLAELMPANSADAFLEEQSSGLPVLYSGTTRQSLSLTLGHAGQMVRALTLAGDPDLGGVQAATLENNPANNAQTLLYVWSLNTINGQQQVMQSFGLTLPFPANDIEFSPSGRWVAATSGTFMAVDPNTPNGVYVWEIVSGAQVAALQLPSAGGGMTFSPDGRFMVVASPAAEIYVFDTATWAQLATLPAAPALSGSTALTFSPNSQWLVFGEQGGTVQVYHTNTWTLLRTLTPEYEGAAAFVDFSPDGTVLAVGIVYFASQHPENRASTLALWDANTGLLLRTLPEFNDLPRALGFRSGGRQLVAIGQQSWWSWAVQ
ncbi:MAG: hypothetical protein JXA10_02415, partial [Anaerolineae bacterium]|nr:hypothetical protein [Anaerolineae bacterium]